MEHYLHMIPCSILKGGTIDELSNKQKTKIEPDTNHLHDNGFYIGQITCTN